MTETPSLWRRRQFHDRPQPRRSAILRRATADTTAEDQTLWPPTCVELSYYQDR